MADGSQREWRKLFAARPDFSVAGVKYLRKVGIRIPHDITLTGEMAGEMTIEDWALLIEDYALNRLKLSGEESHKDLYDAIRDALYTLGYPHRERNPYIHLTHRQVLSHRSNVKDIIRHEMRILGDKIRVAVNRF